jgi:hypothetical protein
MSGAVGFRTAGPNGGEASAGLSGRWSGQLRTRAVGGARGEAGGGGGVWTATLSERRCRPAPLWRGHTWARDAWQPHGESTLTGGPGAESGD